MELLFGFLEQLNLGGVSVLLAGGISGSSLGTTFHLPDLVRPGPDLSLDKTGTAGLRADMHEGRSRSNLTTSIPAQIRCPGCVAGCPGSTEARSIVIRERLLSTVASAYTTGPQATLTEIICESCGALLDTQVTMLETGPLCDGD